MGCALQGRQILLLYSMDNNIILLWKWVKDKYRQGCQEGKVV